MENVQQFFDRHRPPTPESINMLWYSKHDGEKTMRDLLASVRERLSIVLVSDTPGCGKHLLIAFASKLTGTDFTHVDTTTHIETFRDMCRRQDVTEFIKSGFVERTKPYFVFDESVVTDDRSVVVADSFDNCTWPCVYIVTARERLFETRNISKALKRKSAVVVRLRTPRYNTIAKHIKGLSSNYPYKISDRSAMLIAKRCQGNIRYTLSILHRVLTAYEPSRKKRPVMTLDIVRKAFDTACMDSFRKLSDVHEICKGSNYEIHGRSYRLDIALSHPQSFHANRHKNYLTDEKEDLQRAIKRAETFSFSDALPIDIRLPYFVSLYMST